MKIFFIGNPLLSDGYNVSGVEAIPVDSPDELISSLVSLMKRDDVGIVLLDHDYTSQVKDEIDSMKLKKKIPVLVEVPGKKTSADIDLKATISKIMGVKV